MPIRVAQYGTKHGHAEGKLIALRTNPQVELAGVYEPDHVRCQVLQQAGWPWADLHWYADEAELLGDASIVAVASEGRNHESLAQTEAIIRAGKHVWYDKPAGQDLAHWQQICTLAEQQQLIMQIGYMFRYHPGFRQIAAWVADGLLGSINLVRAQMSTNIPLDERLRIARHPGGILYDLGGHMLDQIIGMLGAPQQTSAFLRFTDAEAPHFADTTLAILEYPQALAEIAITAGEAPPPARRFEVYGSQGSVIMEPFEPATHIRLCLHAARPPYSAGPQQIALAACTRQELYNHELDAFLATIRGERPPERSRQHDMLVQATLLALTGAG